jgi:putative resolvase
VKAEEPTVVRVRRAAHEGGLHPVTVRTWITAGTSAALRVGHEARIPRSDIERMVGHTDERLLILSGRVSGHGHKEDRDTHLQRLQAWAATERKGRESLVLSASGSGLNASRRQVQRLLTLVCEDAVADVVIPDEDRLTRFGQEDVHRRCARCGVTLTV